MNDIIIAKDGKVLIEDEDYYVRVDFIISNIIRRYQVVIQCSYTDAKAWDIVNNNRDASIHVLWYDGDTQERDTATLKPGTRLGMSPRRCLTCDTNKIEKDNQTCECGNDLFKVYFKYKRVGRPSASGIIGKVWYGYIDLICAKCGKKHG